MPALDLRELGKRCAVAEHAVDAFDDHQLGVTLALQPPEPTVEIIGIVVPEPDDGRAAQPAAVVNARMRVGVHQDDVPRARKTHQHAEIGLIAGRKDERRTPVEELRDLGLELAMDAVRPVGDPRPRGPGTVFPDRTHRRGHAIRVEGQAEVVVGPDQDRGAAVDPRLGPRQNLVQTDAEGIGPHLQDLVVPTGDQGIFVEEIHDT